MLSLNWIMMMTMTTVVIIMVILYSMSLNLSKPPTISSLDYLKKNTFHLMFWASSTFIFFLKNGSSNVWLYFLFSYAVCNIAINPHSSVITHQACISHLLRIILSVIPMFHRHIISFSICPLCECVLPLHFFTSSCATIWLSQHYRPEHCQSHKQATNLLR